MIEFRAMGSPCRIIASDPELVRHGQQIVHELEQRWSRFLPVSEVSALNERAGHLTIVSPYTYQLVSSAQHAREATDGAFNPLMLDQLCELGYDRTWDEVVSDDRESALLPASVEPIELYPEISAVRLPDGVRFDPGGIGKGLAGDIVATALIDAGSSSVQVELGGDVRVAGPSWDGGTWTVEVNDADHGNSEAATISLPEGGVATSSTVRRRWTRGDRGDVVHHLLDPATGSSAVTDLEAVTAVASTLWWAEVVAKVALMAGADHAGEVFANFGATGMLVRSDPARRYDVVVDCHSVA